MRKIFKLMMSVVAMTAVVGCTTDATEDLSVKVGGKTQLTLSFDDTRTQLGVKGKGETTYPLTWSENDQVSVNGVASDELTVAEGAGSANATFSFGGELATPYCVAFPAAAEGQVEFAAVQNHTSNTTFDSKAAVMYGYSKNGENIKLNHLTGILKIGLSLESTAKIMAVRISTIDRKPIAGAFNLNFETGELTPVEGETSSVITYNLFDENGDAGLDLGMCYDTPYIHIAVPAGVYDELYITLIDEKDNVMYKTVKAYYKDENDDKSLKPGMVREFTNTIKYEAISSSESFVISDFSSLVSFKETIEAAQAVLDKADASDDEKAAATATLSKNAIVVNDLLITPSQISDAGGNWDGIDAANYTGTINGNGYEISGLPTPLFNKTAASFRGLHIKASIEETKNPNFGAFARQLVATTNAPKVENCSVSGTITINTAIKVTASSYYTTSVGAFAGAASGVVFEDCVNNATIEIKSLASSESTKTSQAVVGGIIGYANTANSLFTQFTNCHNAGAIEFNDTSAKLALHLGGIVAVYHGAAATATFDKCSNSGNMTVSSTTAVSSCNLGGIIGYTNGSLSSPKNITFANDIANSGNILLQGTYTSTVRAGGILGYMKECVSLTLNGEVTNSGYIKYDATGVQLWIGGILGSLYSQNTLTINNKLTNTETADITINGKATGSCYFGGIYGYNEYDSNGADDKADTEDDFTSNKISITGKTTGNYADITINAGLSSTCYVGGIFGFSHNTPHNMSNNARVHNTGILRVSNSAVVGSNLYMGGAAGYMNGNSISGTAGQVVNEGEIRFEGEAKGSCYIGGIYGQLWAGTVSNSINVGDIYAIGKVNASKTLRIGGHLGNCNYNKGTRTYKNCQVHCYITAYCVADDKTVTSPYAIGMLTGSLPDNIGKSCDNNKIGGRIVTNNDGSWLTIDATNCADYVIGVRNSGIAFTGVSPLTSKDDIVWGDFGN